MNFHFDVMIEVFPSLIKGAQMTLFITVFGLIGGFILGVLAGLMRTSRSYLLDRIAFCYIELIRGTPLLVQMIYIYYALPIAIGVTIDPIMAAILSIAFNSGAYIGEIVRGAVLSIDKGLIEAGKALGLSVFQVLTTVVGPLAFRRLIPPLGNQFIISLKDTSLCTIIAVAELTRQGMVTVASTFRAFEIWTEVAVLYLVMTQSLAYMMRRIEKRVRIL